MSFPWHLAPYLQRYLWFFSFRSSNPVWHYRKPLGIQRYFASSAACLILIIAYYRTLKIWTDRSRLGISPYFRPDRLPCVSGEFSVAAATDRASSALLYGAVISSFRWSIAAVRQSHDAGIPPPRADRRFAGIPRAALRGRGATQCGQSPR